jgi:hypothetical protein
MHIVIDKGKKLYRGSSENYNKPFSPNRRAVFFANSQNNAGIYSGYVTEYILTHNANVLNMGSANTIEWLISKAASEKLKSAIKKAFRIANNRNVRRFSKMKYDAHVAEFICRLGYDGYYAPRLRTKYPQGHFSSETVLCNPSKFLRVSKVFTPTRPPTNKRGRHGLNLSNMNYKISF